VLSGSCAIAQQNPDKAERHPSLPLTAEEPAILPSLQAKEGALRDVLRSDPNSAETLYDLALVLRQEMKPKESLALYTQAAALRRPTANELRSVALDYVLLNDYDDAVHWLRIAFSTDPTNADVLYSLGRCLYTQNHFDQAELAFRRVLTLRPEHLKAEENLGLTLDAENQTGKAEAALRLAAQWATERKTTDPWPFLDLGVFLLEQQRAAEAVPSLKTAAALAPDMAEAREKLGRALSLTGDAKAGASELEAAVRLDPKDPKAHFELGQAYRNLGEADKARAEFALCETLYGKHSRD
jgi:tetratricopeptide (TPR) repeat protein